MGRHFFYLLFISLTLLASCKKDMLHVQRVWQLDSHTTSTLNNVRFISDSVVIAAGGSTFYSSAILRSADGGYTWAYYTSPDAPKEMRGMDLSADGTIYLCGIDGDVLRSTDKGVSWQFGRIPNWQPHVGGRFVTADTGIFVSSILQRQCTITRIDSSYKILDEQTFLFGLNGIKMISADTGYIFGYGSVMLTADRGNNWRFMNVKGDNFSAMDIHGKEIWMCGANGGVYHTYDGGDSWQTYRNGNDLTQMHYMLRSIVFRDAVNGWACGDEGVLLHTGDGGHHWAEYDHFTNSSLRSVALCPNGDLLVAGDNGSLYRLIP